jgi:hypothetical protein
MNKLVASVIIASLMGISLAGYSVDTSLVKTSARAVALGNAFAPLADDYAALFTNPAGLYLVDHQQFGAMQTNMMDAVSSFSGAGVFPMKGATLGAGFLFNGVSGIPVGTSLVSNRVVAGTQADYANTIVAVGLAAPVDTPMTEPGALVMGITGKFFMENAGGGVNYSSSGINADLGALLRINKAASLSLVYHNFLPTQVKWNTGYQSNVDYSMSIGGRYRLMGQDQESALYSEDQSIDIMGDVALLDQNQKFVPRAGIEYKPYPFLALRGGLIFEEMATGLNTSAQNMKLSLGMGATYEGVRFDYALVMDPNGIDGNNEHYLSMLLDIFPSKKVEPEKSETPRPLSYVNIESPEEHFVTYKNTHIIMGTIVPGVARLTVNDKDVAIKNGRFSTTVTLKDYGKNVVRIIAYDAKDNILGYKDTKILWLMQFPDVGEKHWAKKYIEDLATARVLRGFPDGDFRPNDLIKRGEFSALLVRTKKLPVDESVRAKDDSLFVDIKKHWASPYIKSAFEAGIIDGYPKRKFMPDKATIRQEAVISLVKMDDLKLPIEAPKSQFKDITPSTELNRYVDVSVENGLVIGYPDGTFKPFKDISRAEIAKAFCNSKLGQMYVNDLYDWESYKY